MNKTRNRALSLLLVFAMAVSMMTTAFALGGQVNIKFADGSTTTLANASDVVLYKGGVKNVESVTVSTGADDSLVSDTYTSFGSTIEKTLPLGTKYQIYTARDTSGDETLNFRYTNELNDVINIEVVGQAVTYDVYAGSGVYGQNNNQGGLSTCTISAENATTNLAEGAPYTVTFTPVNGQEITKLNLRIGSADGSGRIVDPVSGNVSLGNQDLRIVANANGSVTVSADSVVRDLYLVALTKDAATRYDFNIRTDGNCTADVTSSSMVAGSTKTVTFTPTSGYTVTDITITEGSVSKTLALADEKVEVNRKSYSVERKLDGSAVLSVPALSDNVFISAVAQDSVHFVKVNANRNVYTNKVGLNAVNGKDTLEVVFAPNRDYTEVRSLTITTPATGTRTYTLDGRVIADSTGFNGYYFDAATGKWFNGSYWENIGDNWIIGKDGRYYNVDTGRWYDYPYLDNNRTVWVRGTDGRFYNTETGKWYDSPYFDQNYNYNYGYNWTYADWEKYYNSDRYNWVDGTTWGVNGTTWTINGATVRLYYDARDFLHVLVQNMTENMEFTANSHDSIHTVNVTADRGIEIEKKSYEVDDGDDMEVTFTPAKDTYAIRTLYITYGTHSYKAAVEDDTYVRVDGTRWNISVDDKGVVTLDMADIAEDVVVRAESNYTVLRNLTISRNPDSRSNITYSGKAPFDSEDKVTLCVYTSRDGYILDKATFKLDSKSVDIKPFDTKLTLGGMTYTVKWIDNTEFSIEFAPLPGSISVSSKTVKGDVEVAPEVPDESDNKNDNKTDTPSTDPIITPPAVTSVTHNAYMKGVGNGKFAPDKSLTRAEAVTLLNRAVLGMDDSATASYASSAYFTDVPASFWGAGAINYAGSQGYLSVLNTSNNFNPNNPITRAEFLALLCKYRNVDVSSASTTTSYVDVPASHWAAQYISYATSQGWVQGVGSSQFTPDSAVTRAAICTMVNHILGRAADSSKTAATGATFSDVPLTYWGYADIFEATFTHQATVNNGVETWM